MMKTFYTVLKVLAALIAVAAIVYVVVAHGEKIANWIKAQTARLRGLFGCCCGDQCQCQCQDETAVQESDFEG